MQPEVTKMEYEAKVIKWNKKAKKPQSIIGLSILPSVMTYSQEIRD
jgi:hypothetical protein